MPRFSLLLLAALVAGCGAPRPAAPPAETGPPPSETVAPSAAWTTGADVVGAMHARWNGRRAPTLTFVQTTVFYRPDAAPDTVTWYEAAAPGRLRIDIAPLDARRAIFYVDGQRTTVRGGRIVDQRPDVNILLVALMDVYHQPPATTLALLDSLGVATAGARTDTWQGQPAVVVGAADSSASQLWVDPARLVPVRVVQRLPDGRVLDAHVGGYRQIGGVWHETEIDLYLDGALVQRELYRDVHPGAAVADDLFDPANVPPPRRYWE